MIKKPVFYSEALQVVIGGLHQNKVPFEKMLVIRDIYGRLQICFDMERPEDEKLEKLVNEVLKDLGPYRVSNSNSPLFREDFYNPTEVFTNGEISNAVIVLQGTELAFRILDRQITGQDWIIPHESGSIPRLVFYGFKGGVGRSTAIAMTAFHLAQKGKKVLLIDLDLESPGLSSLLLPKDSQADFGIVDWFVEDAVGQGEDVLQKMIASSPIGQHTQGSIRIAGAIGVETKDDNYLSKLSRVYADVNISGKIERFADRVHRMVKCIEELERPDVILIDSRAGLHDLAAISIVGLSKFAYLFATNSYQNWQGYKLLFSHWCSYPKSLSKIRDRLSMIYAMFPESDQEKNVNGFNENSYTLFSDTIYENIEPSAGINPEIFNFDLNDPGAPHYPTRINWTSRLQEWDPLRMERGIIDKQLMDGAFGEFLHQIESDLELLSNE